MTAYIVQLGFDWNAQANGFDGDNPVYLLQWGVVAVGPNNTQTISTLENLSNGDTIQFQIYDVSTIAGNAASPSGTVPSITPSWFFSDVADAHTPSGTYPFTSTSVQQVIDANVGTLSAGQQTPVFGPTGFAMWPVNSNGSALSAVLSNSGSGNIAYQLTWTVEVNSPQLVTPKIFKVDPEMIVKPGG